MPEVTFPSSTTAIIGAGLAGLTAAYSLNEAKRPVAVFEAEPYAGGASRTVQFGDFRFDLGGNRFYTRNQEVLALLRKLIGPDLLTVARQSRILLDTKLVDYPLAFFNALSALGPFKALDVAQSYAQERIRSIFNPRPEISFEDWVVSRFGRKLYDIYFRPYSEKVWGIPCTELSADFAAQRIKGLSFREAVKNMIFPEKNTTATLISQFWYPSLGFGRIIDTLAEPLPADSIQLNSPVVRFEHDQSKITRITYKQNGEEKSFLPEYVINTIPITNFIRSLDPLPPQDVLDAAAGLRFRDIVFVFLTFKRTQITPDHWIYFPSENCFFGRVHEPKNWSALMAPPDKTSLVVEIFCNDTDAIWQEADDSLINCTSKRLEELNLINPGDTLGGCVIRLRKAYPLYFDDYKERLDKVMAYLAPLKNLQNIGRSGLFRYTSGDYYMEMGMKTAANLLGANHNINAIATAQEYGEK